MLAHELAHVRNRDALLGSLQALAAMLYWWNPLVHVLVRRLSLVREMLSDHAASGHLSPAAYAASLLKLAETAGRRTAWRPASAYGLSLAFGHPLEQRFKMLTRHFTTTNHQPKTMKLTIAIVAALAATAAVCATIDTSLAEDTTPAQTQSPGGNAALIADLQNQVSQLQAQIAQLNGAPQQILAAPAAPAAGLSGFAAEATDEPGFFLAGPDGEGRIELDQSGILTITGAKGEGMLRVDTNSGIAKTIVTFIEKMFETAIVEMERELEQAR